MAHVTRSWLGIEARTWEPLEEQKQVEALMTRLNLGCLLMYGLSGPGSPAAQKLTL